MVELSDWDKKKQVEGEENVAKNEKIAMKNLKNRVDDLEKTNIVCSNTNFSVSSRKRSAERMPKSQSKRTRVSAPELDYARTDRKGGVRRSSQASIRLMNEWILNKKIATSTPVKASTADKLFAVPSAPVRTQSCPDQIGTGSGSHSNLELGSGSHSRSFGSGNSQARMELGSDSHSRISCKLGSQQKVMCGSDSLSGMAVGGDSLSEVDGRNGGDSLSSLAVGGDSLSEMVVGSNVACKAYDSSNKYVEFDSTGSSMRDAIAEAYDSVRIAELKQGFGSTNSSEDYLLANLSALSSRAADSHASARTHSGGYAADSERSSSVVGSSDPEYLDLLSDEIFKVERPATCEEDVDFLTLISDDVFLPESANNNGGKKQVGIF